MGRILIKLGGNVGTCVYIKVYFSNLVPGCLPLVVQGYLSLHKVSKVSDVPWDCSCDDRSGSPLEDKQRVLQERDVYTQKNTEVYCPFVDLFSYFLLC